MWQVKREEKNVRMAYKKTMLLLIAVALRLALLIVLMSLMRRTSSGARAA